MTCELTDDELNEWIAINIMGWKKVLVCYPDGTSKMEIPVQVPWFCGDLNAASKAELKIEVDEWDYAEALIKVMEPKMWQDHDEIGEPLDYAILYKATARQRMEAIWEVMK